MLDELEKIKKIYGDITYNIINSRLNGHYEDISNYEDIAYLSIKYGIPELISYIYIYKETPLQLNKLILEYTNIIFSNNNDLSSVPILSETSNNSKFSPIILDEYVNDRHKTIAYVNYLIKFSIRDVKSNYYRINKKYISHYNLLYAY